MDTRNFLNSINKVIDNLYETPLDYIKDFRKKMLSLKVEDEVLDIKLTKYSYDTFDTEPSMVTLNPELYPVLLSDTKIPVDTHTFTISIMIYDKLDSPDLSYPIRVKLAQQTSHILNAMDVCPKLPNTNVACTKIYCEKMLHYVHAVYNIVISTKYWPIPTEKYINRYDPHDLNLDLSMKARMMLREIDMNITDDCTYADHPITSYCDKLTITKVKETDDKLMVTFTLSYPTKDKDHGKSLIDSIEKLFEEDDMESENNHIDEITYLTDSNKQFYTLIVFTDTFDKNNF